MDEKDPKLPGVVKTLNSILELTDCTLSSIEHMDELMSTLTSSQRSKITARPLQSQRSWQ